MKNLLLIPVFVLAMVSGKATDIPTLSIGEEKTFILNVMDWNTDELHISLLTEKGDELYSESIQPAEKKFRKFNLEQLPGGTYKMVVSDDFKSIIYEISISKDAVAEVSKGITSYIPQIFTTDEKVDINLLPLGKKVKIFLYDANGHDLYYDNIYNSMVVEKRLDISRLDEGNYTLGISIGDSWYTQSFEK